MKAEAKAAVLQHLGAFFEERELAEFDWHPGPLHGIASDFRVCRIAPRAPVDPWVYVTLGASQFPTRDGDGTSLEFVLRAPTHHVQHIETLAMLTYLHADPLHGLGLHHTIPIGRPWMPGASCDFFLVSLPYAEGPTFEYVRRGDVTIRLLWLVPLFKAEADYARKHGVEALERRLEKAQVDTLALRRKSVVSRWF